MALKSDGTVWSWGQNDFGQCGYGSNQSSLIPKKIDNLSNIIDITAGVYHSLALKSDKTVYAWGNNEYGQLGSNTSINQNEPVVVSSLTGIKSIAAGNSHSIALNEDGYVYEWGLNSFGKADNDISTKSEVPIIVDNLDNISKIAADGDFSLALKNDGTIRAWGHNRYGQLGDATIIDRSVPVIGGVIPVVLISENKITDNLAPRGVLDYVLYGFYLEVSDADIILNSLTITTAGSYEISDIGEDDFKLYYSLDEKFDNDDLLLTSHQPVGSGQDIEFNNFLQTIEKDKNAYLLISAQISDFAVGGRNIYIDSTYFENIGLNEKNALKTGDAPVPEGTTHTFPLNYININSVDIGNHVVSQNTANQILYQLSLNPSEDIATLTDLFIKPQGSYIQSDLVSDSFRLIFSKDNVFEADDPILGVHSIVPSEQKISFNNLSQPINKGDTVYLFITSDISPTAGGKRDISIQGISFADISFKEPYILKQGNDPLDVGGIQTFILSVINVATPAVEETTVSQDVKNHVIYQINMAIENADTSFSGLTLTTAGSYQTTDIKNYKLWYSSDNVLNDNDSILKQHHVVEPGDQIGFNSFSHFLSKDSTAYIFITTDISSRAIVRNISINAVQLENIIFNDVADLKISDDILNGNAQTFTTPKVDITFPEVSAQSVFQNNEDHVLYRIDLSVNDARVNLQKVSFTTGGSYIISDISYFKLYYSSDNQLDENDKILGNKETSVSGSTFIYDSLLYQIEADTTAYLFITADIAASNCSRTVYVNEIPLKDIEFTENENIVITGTNPGPNGGIQTFPSPSINISSDQIQNTEVEQEISNIILYKFDLSVSQAEAVFDTLTLTTAGTYISKDIKPDSFKLWYSKTKLFEDNSLLLSQTAFVETGSKLVFDNLSHTINKDTPEYFFITFDTSLANGARSIQITETPFSNIVFQCGNISGQDNVAENGPIPAGGIITFPIPDIVLTAPQITEADLSQDISNHVLYQINVEVTRAEAVLKAVSLTTAGTYLQSDIDKEGFN